MHNIMHFHTLNHIRDGNNLTNILSCEMTVPLASPLISNHNI